MHAVGGGDPRLSGGGEWGAFRGDEEIQTLTCECSPKS